MHTSTVCLNCLKSSYVFSPRKASNLRQMDHMKIIKLKGNQTMLQQACVLMSYKLVEETVKKGAVPSAL